MTDATFKLRITFTGLYSMVPNKPLAENPTKLCFLLVDARKDDVDYRRRPLDLHGFLNRHVGFLSMDPRNLGAKVPPGKESNLIWYLDRERINFLLDQKTSTALDVPADLSDSVIAMDKICGGFSDVDTTTYARNPRGDVLAQIVIGNGKLKPMAGGLWKFPDALDRHPGKRALAHELSVEIEGLTSASLLSTPFGEEEPMTVKLVPWPNEDSDVNIVVSNVCETNPLGWKATTTYKDAGYKDDVDFKWHYELLSPDDRKELMDKLRTKGTGILPHPKPDPESPPAIGGENCFGNTAHDAIIDLDP